MNNVPYYHLLFKKADLKPTDIQTINDLHKIPISKKSDLKPLPLDMTVARNINLRRCYRQATSGTSGTPFFPHWTKQAWLLNDFAHARWQLSCGFRLTDRVISVGGDILLLPFHKVGILTRRISPFEDIETQIEQIKRFNPETIFIYPSCLKILAKEIKERNAQGISVERIFTLGEILDLHTRELAKDAMDAEVFDGYGSVEVGAICAECVRHEYHIQADFVVVEAVQNGEIVSAGEEGEVTVTSLSNYAMPFIRYNLGDLGVILEDRPHCDNRFPLMRITTGRKSDVALLPNGVLIPANEFRSFLTRVRGIRQFQIVQEEIDWFRIKIVKEADFKNARVDEIKQGLLAIIGRRLSREQAIIEIDIEVVDHIPLEKSGKFNEFKTRVNMTRC